MRDKGWHPESSLQVDERAARSSAAKQQKVSLTYGQMNEKERFCSGENFAMGQERDFIVQIV